jgi:hypothetical protein
LQLLRILFALIAAIVGSSKAADLTLTGFGTIGYAVSDSELTYLRYIDDRGTLKADSLVGVQAEARFTPRWSATVQAVASAPRKRDDGLEAQIRWAFLSFRPSNDWLIRLGRVRPPVFINTQNAEVGITYDQARLPAEVYTLSPVYDLDGAAVNKTFSIAPDAEINLEAYWGKTDTAFRDHYQRDPPARYFRERITSAGTLVAFSSGSVLLRAGYHHAKLTAKGSDSFPRSVDAIDVPAPPPFGGTVYTPSEFTREVHVRVFTLGADWRFDSWRATAEYAWRKTPESDLVANDRSAYITLARELGRWTPYVTYARLLSKPEARAIFREVYDTPVPLAAQASPFFVPENAHRLFGDRINVSDQYSIMLGASYRFTASSMLKLEWMRTKVGLVSNLVDGDARGKSFNVFSLSYSVGF